MKAAQQEARLGPGSPSLYVTNSSSSSSSSNRGLLCMLALDQSSSADLTAGAQCQMTMPETAACVQLGWQAFVRDQQPAGGLG